MFFHSFNIAAILLNIKAMIVLIDNYDSFTYNLVQYFGDLGAETRVLRNDQVSVDEICEMKPKGIVISPGPSDPDHAGICLEMVLRAARDDLPLFGVCLGHQTIGQAFGGKIIKTKPFHGKISVINHEGESVFKGVKTPLEVARYHSLTIDPASLPACLRVSASTDDGVIMGVWHESAPIHGVQFHPESIATQDGMQMLQNFLDYL